MLVMLGWWQPAAVVDDEGDAEGERDPRGAGEREITAVRERRDGG